jgi:hypothetical protein
VKNQYRRDTQACLDLDASSIAVRAAEHACGPPGSAGGPTLTSQDVWGARIGLSL